MLGRCWHEFSWPRRATDGEYYQTCQRCDTAFHYDWKTMQRGGRADAPVEHATTVRRRSGQRQQDWKPRSRRLRTNIPVRYRGKSLDTWYEGFVLNVSQSGVMLHGPEQLPVNSAMEMIFEMPEEICGQKNRPVLCQGKLIRVKDALDNVADAYALAATVLDYEFIDK